MLPGEGPGAGVCCLVRVCVAWGGSVMAGEDLGEGVLPSEGLGERVCCLVRERVAW